MRSATDFLPLLISTFTNFATSTLPNLGSGRTSRLGTSLRRGIPSQSRFSPAAQQKRKASHSPAWRGGRAASAPLRRLRPLRAVLGAALLAILHPLQVEAAAHD